MRPSGRWVAGYRRELSQPWRCHAGDPFPGADAIAYTQDPNPALEVTDLDKRAAHHRTLLTACRSTCSDALHQGSMHRLSTPAIPRIRRGAGHGDPAAGVVGRCTTFSTAISR